MNQAFFPRFSFRIALLLTLALGMIGCGPDAKSYVAPTGPAQKLATIWNNTSDSFSPQTVVTKIDDFAVRYSAKWRDEELSDPIKITSGWHRIGAWVNEGEDNEHYSEFDFYFKAGHGYRVKHADSMDYRVRMVDQTTAKSYRIFKETQFTPVNLLLGNRRSIMPPRDKTAAANKSPAPIAEKKPAKPAENSLTPVEAEASL